jgi:hypothetical protein
MTLITCSPCGNLRRHFLFVQDVIFSFQDMYFFFFQFYFNFYLSLIVIIKQVSSKGLEEEVVILAESVALFWFVSFVSKRNVKTFSQRTIH